MFGAAVTVESGTDTLSLNDAPIVGGDIPAGLDVPTTGALNRFADVSWAPYAGSAADAERWPPETSLTYLPLRGTAGSGSGGTLAGNAEAAHVHWPRVLGTFATLR